MSIYVFIGPSITQDDARQELDAIYLPPVSEGDITRLASTENPQAIGIIDGYFENVPSVWHKEILFAMKRGIHVFGASSMGALRAAELHQFGMEGVGAIFEAYRDGLIEDDDEVAVTHGPAELGYPALSEAMVNIRRTLSDALSDSVIGQASYERLEELAKALPYKDRSYANLMDLAREYGLDRHELDAFSFWLPNGRADQKQEDAVQLLRTLRLRIKGEVAPKSVRYHFEHTTLWEQALRNAEAAAT